MTWEAPYSRRHVTILNVDLNNVHNMDHYCVDCVDGWVVGDVPKIITLVKQLEVPIWDHLAV